MYLIATLVSVHEKFDVWTGPKRSEEWIFNESQRGNNDRSETIIIEKPIDLSQGQ